MRDFSSPLAGPFDFPQGDHGVLLIHGFTGTPAHLRLVGEGLHGAGFAVRGMLLPGHGESPQAMARVGWQDWVRAARLAAREMMDAYPHVSVAGLSMGGCLALMLAEEMDVTACVPIAAPMKTVSRFRGLAPLAAPFMPMIHKRADGSRDTLDQRYDLGYAAYPTRSIAQLSAVMRMARRHLHLIHCPVLAIQSHGDATVTPDSPDIILRGVSSWVRARLWLDQAPHVCTIAPEYPRIVAGMTEFLRRAQEAPPETAHP